MRFGKRFNFVSEGSVQGRVIQHGDNAPQIVLSNIKVPRNGYCYVYVSNESPMSVYFDDLKVRHDNGRILEETHYYAYGLKIAPLSSRASGAIKNNYLYQGDYSEFDDEIGWNNFMLRSYDPELGRFMQQDPYDQFANSYTGMGNDPANLVDPTGGWGDPITSALSQVACPGSGGMAGKLGGGSLLLSTVGTILRIAPMLRPGPVRGLRNAPPGTNPGNPNYWRRSTDGQLMQWENGRWVEKDERMGSAKAKSIHPPGYRPPPKFDPNNRLDRAMRDGVKRKLERQAPLATAEEDEADDRGDVFYITYTKSRVNEDGTITIYTGRTRGYGDMTRENAEKYIRIRDRNHHKNEFFEEAVFDQMNRSYDAIRGREQQMIDHNGGAYKDRDWRPYSGGGPGRSGNDIRGVRRNHPFRRRFHDAASREFGERFRFTGE